MVTGQLERAFRLADKHKLDVSTVLELDKIIMKELNGSAKVEEKILQQIIQVLENNKTILKEATQELKKQIELYDDLDTFD